MSNKTNNVYAEGQKSSGVMIDNEKYYPQQPANHNNSDSLTEEMTNVQGVVSNCVKLNVRREAQKRTDNVLCVISAGDVLAIDEKRSTNAWFYVTTVDGVSGYCMKEFVTVE